MWPWCRHRGRGFRAPWVKIWNLMMIRIHRECSVIQLWLKVVQTVRRDSLVGKCRLLTYNAVGLGCPEFESRILLHIIIKAKHQKWIFKKKGTDSQTHPPAWQSRADVYILLIKITDWKTLPDSNIVLAQIRPHLARVKSNTGCLSWNFNWDDKFYFMNCKDSEIIYQFNTVSL